MRDLTKTAIEYRNSCIKKIDEFEEEIDQLKTDMDFLEDVIFQEFGKCKCDNWHWPQCNSHLDKRLDGVKYDG